MISVTCAKRGNGVSGRARGRKTSLAPAETTTTRSACIGRRASGARACSTRRAGGPALQRCKLSLVPANARRGRQALAARQRDKVVKRRCRRVQRGIVPTDATASSTPFEKACHVHDVRCRAWRRSLGSARRYGLPPLDVSSDAAGVANTAIRSLPMRSENAWRSGAIEAGNAALSASQTSCEPGAAAIALANSNE